MANPERPKRYTTLEGMRGVAAICVVLMHGVAVFGRAAPHSAYLAVDFFFALSGFILAHAYSAALDQGLGAMAFLRARVIRLYPMYILGTLSAVAWAVAPVLLGRDDALWAYTQPPSSLPFALLMLPSPASDVLYPLNVPAWSLLLELVVNAAFAVRLLRSTSALVAVVAVSAVLLAAGAVTTGSLDLGWGKANAAWGLARVFFSFPLGVLLYRLHRGAHPGDVLSAVAVAALAALFFIDLDGAMRPAFDLAFVFVASPILVLVGARCRPVRGWLVRLCLFLGAVSYPIYALHHPTLMAALGMITRHAAPGTAAMVAGLAVVAAMITAARGIAVVDYRVGIGIQRLLQRRWGSVKPASPGRRSASG